jgi:hypothetical protein
MDGVCYGWAHAEQKVERREVSSDSPPTPGKQNSHQLVGRGGSFHSRGTCYGLSKHPVFFPPDIHHQILTHSWGDYPSNGYFLHNSVNFMGPGIILSLSMKHLAHFPDQMVCVTFRSTLLKCDDLLDQPFSNVTIF